MSDTPDAGPLADLVLALADLADPRKDGQVNAGQRRYRYLELSDLLAEVRAKMGAHRWAIMQVPDVVDGTVVVTNVWVHTSGERIEHPPFALPCGRSPQEIGSALTYARRYSLAALVGLAGSVDDDAQAAQQGIAQARQHRAQADRTVETTRPVERAPARRDDPANAPYQTRPAEPAEPSARTTTQVPWTGHQAHEHGATDKSIQKMWALLRGQGWDQDTIRTKVAGLLGVDEWHTPLLTQAQVSQVIGWLEPDGEEAEAAR